MVRISRSAFERIVRRTVAELPETFRERLGNVAFVVMRRPPREILVSEGIDGESDTLLGYYEGVPLTEAPGPSEGAPIPESATIYVFQEPIEEACATRAEIAEEIRRTVIHEVAHHFGLDEDDVARRGFD